MPFSLEQYAVVSLVLFASSIVQGAVGFAAGLFGIPLLVLSGISFPDAVAIILVAAAPQNMIPAWRLRREIDFRRALRPLLIRYAFLPLGVAVLWLVGQGGKSARARSSASLYWRSSRCNGRGKSSRSRDCTRLGSGWRLAWPVFCSAFAGWGGRQWCCGCWRTTGR